MSLTAFNRIRRMNQVEEMKPENIKKAQEEKAEEVPVKEEIKIEAPVEEVKEEKVEEKPNTQTARRRNTRKE